MSSRLQLAARAALALTAFVTTACGASGSPSRTSSSTATVVTRTAPRRHAHALPHVGTRELVRANGVRLSVTVTRVIDPLTDSGAALQPSTRAVGVVVEIQNHGPGVYDSSATGDVSIVPSSGSATPVFAAHGICQTPLRDFDNYITAGEARHGCVAFSIDTDARVAAVRFSPHGQAAGRATWAAFR